MGAIELSSNSLANLETRAQAVTLVGGLIEAGVAGTRGFEVNHYSFSDCVARRLELPVGTDRLPLIMVSPVEHSDLIREVRIENRGRKMIFVLYSQIGSLTELDTSGLKDGQISVEDSWVMTRKRLSITPLSVTQPRPEQIRHLGLSVGRGFGVYVDLFSVTLPTAELFQAMPKEADGWLLTQQDIDQRRQQLVAKKLEDQQALIGKQENSLELWQRSKSDFFSKLWRDCGNQSGRETYISPAAKIIIRDLKATVEALTSAVDQNLTDTVLITIANVDRDKLDSGVVRATQDEPVSLVLRYTRYSDGNIDAESFLRQRISNQLVDEGILNEEHMAALVGLLKIEPMKQPVREPVREKKTHRDQIGPRHHRYK